MLLAVRLGRGSRWYLEEGKLRSGSTGAVAKPPSPTQLAPILGLGVPLRGYSSRMAAAYLFTWNPEKFQWEKRWPGELAQLAKRSRNSQAIELSWSCAKSTLPQRGDRAFFIKLGRYGRGIFASGWITRGSHDTEESDFGPRGVEIE